MAAKSRERKPSIGNVKGYDAVYSRDVTAAMLVYKNNRRSLLWEPNPIFMQIPCIHFVFFSTPLWPPSHVSENHLLLVPDVAKVLCSEDENSDCLTEYIACRLDENRTCLHLYKGDTLKKVNLQ